MLTLYVGAQELCESRGGRRGLPVPNKPPGFCGRKATLKDFVLRFFPGVKCSTVPALLEFSTQSGKHLCIYIDIRVA